jgi:putative membrane protein
LLGHHGSAVWAAPWWWAKLAMLVGLFALHGLMARYRREFAEDRNRRPAKFYKIFNEVPTVLMIAAVIFAVVKPF